MKAAAPSLIFCLVILLMLLSREAGKIEGAMEEQAMWEQPGCVNLTLGASGFAVSAKGAQILEIGR
jgi:hypothetical protein